MIEPRPCELLRPQLRLVRARGIADFYERLWWLASYGGVHALGESPDDALRRFDVAFSDGPRMFDGRAHELYGAHGAVFGEPRGTIIARVVFVEEGALPEKPEYVIDTTGVRCATIYATLLTPETP